MSSVKWWIQFNANDFQCHVEIAIESFLIAITVCNFDYSFVGGHSIEGSSKVCSNSLRSLRLGSMIVLRWLLGAIWPTWGVLSAESIGNGPDVCISMAKAEIELATAS